MINLLLAILLTSIVAILLVNTKFKGIVALSTVIIVGLLSSYFAVKALMGSNYVLQLEGTAIFGQVPIRIDALSGWFIMVINFTIFTGAVYGFNYMKQYRGKKNEITLHCIAFILVQFALVGICSVQNGFILLLLWELTALSVFILIIFEHEKPETIKAAINYIVQSHLSIVFLMLGFIYVAYKTGSYSFDAVEEFSKQQSTLAGTAPFSLFFYWIRH